MASNVSNQDMKRAADPRGVRISPKVNMRRAAHAVAPKGSEFSGVDRSRVSGHQRSPVKDLVQTAVISQPADVALEMHSSLRGFSSSNAPIEVPPIDRSTDTNDYLILEKS
jgi:hypothetical protein